MAPLTCPVCAAPVRQGDLICINCGANLARREPPQQQYPQDQPQGYQEQGYPPQQGYQGQDQQGYHGQGQDQPQQGGYPPQQAQGYPPQQQGYPPSPPQQQGYGGGYGSPGAPHVPPPPREPTMTGGESTAAFTPFCPHCGAEIPDIGSPVCVQCLRPINDVGGGGGGPQQINVVVTFSSGDLQVTPGQELVLGRDPVHSPVASAFSRFDNVSRRHATLGIDNSGPPWIRAERSTDGTFVNDRRLQPGEQTSLCVGDSVRLAADARGQVRVGR